MIGEMRSRPTQIALVALGFVGAAACSFSWDDFDPRLADTGGGGASPPAAGGGGGVPSTGAMSAVGGAAQGGASSNGGGGNGGRAPISVTFGERPGSDFSNVTHDTFISDASTTGSNGDEEIMWADDTSGSDDVVNALLRFELTAIPVSATVEFAELSLWASDHATAGSSSTTEIFVVLEGWTENDANWVDRNPAQNWTTPGAEPPGSSDPMLLTAISTPVGETEYVIDITDQVQSWTSAPSSNNGIVLTQTTDDGAAYATSEVAIVERRPQLTIRYVQ
jgi:hypothetical protein